MENADCVIIGAGVIGLAIGRSLAEAGRDVLILEEKEHIGMETSSRNSEVVHAGIYYPKNSLKAKLCVSGRKLIYDFFEKFNIKYKKVGKLIVATNTTELKELKNISNKAINNGVILNYFTQSQVKEIEPEVKCLGALYSIETGIFDSHSYMLALQADIEKSKGTIVNKCKVTKGKIQNNGIVIEICDKNKYQLYCKTLINCAGLNAQNVSSKISGIRKDSIPNIFYAKGNYFNLNTKSPFSRLIYPVPSKNSLGIHFTLDLANQGRFGPDLEWCNSISYQVGLDRLESFYNNIKKYWPNLDRNMLEPGYAGIRPKLNKEKTSDFLIHTPKSHYCDNYYALYGIESPGLTSSLSIAKYVKDLIIYN